MPEPFRLLDLNSSIWEDFDPRDRKAGPTEYPDDLLGTVQWVRTYTEGPLETDGASIGLSICHMRGEATSELAERTNTETEIMILLEGEAEAAFPDGRHIDVSAPQIVVASRGLTFSWRYKTPYRGIYVIIW
jgi:hypothetical protein